MRPTPPPPPNQPPRLRAPPPPPTHLQNDGMKAHPINIHVMAVPFDIVACPNTATVWRSQLMPWFPLLVNLPLKWQSHNIIGNAY